MNETRGPLMGKFIVLGVSGGIAAYKAIELARLLTLDGAEVQTTLTRNALSFVQPLPFEVLTGRVPIRGTFPIEGAEYVGDMPHISLTDRADLILLAPATANIIGKFAQGIGDDFLSTLLLSARSAVLVAPAMNPRMWAGAAVQENIATLRRRGHIVMTPSEGRMARAEEGQGRGRMPEPTDILREVQHLIGPAQDLSGMNLIVTAGPTRERWDAIRYLSNRSSGKMGFAIAHEAARRGAKVTLVSGPVSLADPPGIQTIRIESAAEMHKAVQKAWPNAHAAIMAAAVADYRPARPSMQKHKKEDGPTIIELERTTDILASLSTNKGKRLLVGFAAESERVAENARNKLRRKNLDLIIANPVSGPDDAMGAEASRAILIGADGIEKELPTQSKSTLAGLILDHLAEMWQNKDLRNS